MNDLQYETSPYLLQHAHNPVNWYAWKPEVLERAKRENKPILVSIGYSTCHWCHVMERESFENEGIAAYMNENFINIKVDREERPDLDDIYMSACQIVTGRGGWPLNCFLTPDGKPFYAGMYFPPEPAHGHQSWSQILQFTLYNFTENRTAVNQQADRIMARIANSNAVGEVVILEGLDTKKVFTTELLDTIFGRMKMYFDTKWGGFGSAPKFPDIMKLRYLLNHYYFTKEEAALTQLELSLDGMVQGGIYDQIGGGLARYATDNEWLAPHFEKMLYDNGLIISLLSDTFKLTKKSIYEKAIRQTLDYVKREMTNEQGGFYAALDADSEGVEGKFYVWSKQEVDSILGGDSPLFCDFYDVTAKGNWEGTNILRRLQSIETFAAEQNQTVAEIETKLAACRQKLFEVRSLRIRPSRDEKSLLSWNAVMCSGYASAYAALQEEAYKTAAENNIQFMLKNMQTADGHLLRTYSEKDGGQAKYAAYLEDYAYFIKALLDLYEINFEVELLETAKRFTDIVLEEFYDAKDKLFFFTSLKQDDIIMRKKVVHDGEKPCGNSLMVHNFQKLGLLFDNQNYTKKATEMLLAIKSAAEQTPSPFANWTAGMQNEVHGINEIAIIGKDATQKAAEINATFIPNKLIMTSKVANDNYPLLKNREEGLIYLCKNYACLRPVESVEEVLEMVGDNEG